jgi:CDP-diglyceride synthetase
MSLAKLKLIRLFLLYTFSACVFFIVIQYARPVAESNLVKFYLPLTFSVSLLLYLLQFRQLIASANFEGDGKYYLFIPFFMGVTLVPLAFIYAFAQPDMAIEFFYKLMFALGVLGIMFLIFWLVVKWGDEDWTTEEDDKPTLQ